MFRARLVSFIIRVLARTWSLDVQGQLPMQPCVVAFWHGSMLPIWWAFRGLRPTAMVSASRDGALLAQLLQDWNYRTVRGSSSQGGSAALSDLVRAAHDHVVMITPDGPRGPAQVMKPGAVVAAQRAGVPLLLVTARVSRARIFERSWDRFALPLPFATVTLVIDTPLTIPPDADRDTVDGIMAQCEQRLRAITDVVGI
jgi:hypothetical protein